MSDSERIALGRRTLYQHGWQGARPALYLHGPSQQLFAYHGDGALWGRWRISTARHGFGNQDGSGCTPTGCHQLGDFIGDGEPIGMRFIGREPTGEVALTPLDPTADYITTRIIRLKGTETGINEGAGVDSFARYIYIHGTPHEAQLGQPVSHGCIRMKSAHLMTLFAGFAPGDQLYIDAGVA
uniref:L,D-TPase catalytic domain-containing protein n=1 Tax=Magnetococcus massalia (strain MO-1) TaxID=451514 RepID=A0A1S7LPD3_MAGMO|nr:Conserved protein of unknown function [Candidatus Magnetococcus massalia]